MGGHFLFGGGTRLCGMNRNRRGGDGSFWTKRFCKRQRYEYHGRRTLSLIGRLLSYESLAITREQRSRDSEAGDKIYFFEACSVSGDSVLRPLEFGG